MPPPSRASSRTSRRPPAGTTNLMPPIIEAVKGNCTLGEISGSLEKVFGRYNPALGT